MKVSKLNVMLVLAEKVCVVASLCCCNVNSPSVYAKTDACSSADGIDVAAMTTLSASWYVAPTNANVAITQHARRCSRIAGLLNVMVAVAVLSSVYVCHLWCCFVMIVDKLQGMQCMMRCDAM